MTSKRRRDVLEQQLESPKPEVVDMYGRALDERVDTLLAVPEFTPTVLSEFAAGYLAAIGAISKYGITRVHTNAQSGIPQ
jgi:hypothetical protein